jgi:hypothetical protein
VGGGLEDCCGAFTSCCLDITGGSLEKTSQRIDRSPTMLDLWYSVSIFHCCVFTSNANLHPRLRPSALGRDGRPCLLH